MTFYFAMNLLCAYVSCARIHEAPSDPLHSRSLNGKLRQEQEELPVNSIVEINEGKIQGYIMQTIRERRIHAFEGIPYGESTSGSNRFEPPIPIRPWKGIRQTKKVSQVCVQFHLIHFRITGSEDCLYLNVYTPELPSEGHNPKLPILVFFHGGGYIFGAGSEYGPAYLLEHDVILITVNHRLGILGFLSTGDKYLPGNLGLKDSALALKWVHENIGYFGGDAKKVTLMGQSAGGFAVHLHMISNMTREYFSGSISMSGTGFNSMIGKAESTRNNLRRLSKITRCDYRDSKKFVECLKRINPYFLVQRSVGTWRSPIPYPPVIEEEGPTAFLTQSPEEAYATGEVYPIPWMCTYNEDEGHFLISLISGFRLENSFLRRWKKLAPYILNLNHHSDNPARVLGRIEEFYFNTHNLTQLKNFKESMGDLFTDRYFSYWIHKGLKAHSQIAPTYASELGYKGRYGFANIVGLPTADFGLGHTDELPYYFNMSQYFPGYKTTDKEFAIVKLLTGFVANFANYRIPYYIDEDGENVKIWEEIKNPNQIRILEIKEASAVMADEGRQRRLEFWESLANELDDVRPIVIKNPSSI